MGIYSINKSTVTKNYVFSGDDIIMNFNKWKPNTSNNILYITGLSGSGKTTLAKDYEKNYKAELFEIDGLDEDYDSSKSKLLEKARIKFPEFSDLLSKKNDNLSSDKRIDLLRKVLLYIISEMHNNKTTLYILEGIQIFEWLNPNTLKNKPLIIKGTSMTKSIYQRWKRNGDGKIDWIAELQDDAPQLFKWYMSSEKELNKFKKAVNENGTLIIESTSSKRRWKCPYCNYHDTRENLVSHVDKIHSDMLSEEYPASRAVFNFINKKEHGTCIMCKRETKWNDTTWRYDRLCGRKKCEEDYTNYMKSNMVSVYGKEHLLNDAEKQKEMLANRKISGTYKFADGGIRSYCGSYEKKLLEFFDKVMNTHSRDVLTPGPIIEYEYNGKSLKWITDVYYLPANLVFDVKDGGDNPNNRQMQDYREKQIAKETAISKLNKYNYIRLTDNNFEQLLLILAQLKHQMIDDTREQKDFIININESILNESNNKSTRHLYHLSEKDLNNIILHPRIPQNRMTKNNNENNEIARISFSSFITGSLIGITGDLTDKEFYVHIIDESYSEPKIKKITNDDVPDQFLSKEVWVLNDVKLKLIGKIKVTKTFPQKYKQGRGYMTNNNYKWKWIEKHDKAINESKLNTPTCTKCGSKNVGVFIQGEPIYKCKDCGKFLGEVPCNLGKSKKEIKEDSATAAALPAQNNQSDNVYIVPYMINNVFNVGLTNDKYFSNFYKIEDNKIERGSIRDLYESEYSIYKYIGEDTSIIYNSIMDDFNNQVDVDNYYFYSKLSKKKLLDYEQISYDDLFKEDIDSYIEADVTTQCIEATIVYQAKNNIITELKERIDNKEIKFLNIEKQGVSILQDINGYFVYNEALNTRSKSYDNISSIPSYVTYAIMMMNKL